MARQQKILSFSLCVVAGFLFSFFAVESVGAEGADCAGSYGKAGFSCNVQTACDDSDKSKDTAKEVVIAEGNVEIDKANGAIITGGALCTDSKTVCCIKKSVPATDGATTPASGAGGGNAGTSECGSVCQWITTNYPAPEGYVKGGGAIPECAFSGQCRNTNDLVQIFINQGKAIFGLIGVVALAAFVYGGFLMVFSFGASDKVQQGKDVMVAAVIGIIIVFSAYLIVNFILNALGVGVDFQAIK